MKKLNPDYLFYAIFFIISILVLWDLLLPGYILTLDMIFTDTIRLSDIFYSITSPPLSSAPFRLLLFFLNKIFPMWLIQKITLLSILFFSGVFAYQSCLTKNKIGKFFAGLIYMVNPFVFVRFLAGHLFLLIGYMFLPLMIKSFMEFFEKQTTKTIIKASLLLTSVSIFSDHFIPVVFGIFTLFLFVNIPKKKHILKAFMFIITIYLLINFYWILPLIFNPNSHLRTIQEWIGPEDIIAFGPRPSLSFNTIFNLASMHGFWRQGYDYAKFHIPFWYLLFFLILFLTIYGFFVHYDDEKYGTYVKSFAIIAVGSLILATGITHPFFSKIFEFLFENVPFFRGFREPQKFVALLVLTYSFLGGIGLGDIVNQITKTKRHRILFVFLIMILLVTPIIYSYTMFFGFHDQLETVWYPNTWYEADNYLNSDERKFKVLFLPWHAYMDFGFNPKQRISNPSEGFFSKPVIKGDNVEVGNIFSQSTNPTSKYIEYLLFNRTRTDNFGELVAPLNIKYIVLAKEVDWETYSFLFEQKDLEIVMDNSDLVVLKNKVETTKIYETDILLNGTDWDKLLSGQIKQEIHPLDFEKKSPVLYLLKEKPTKKYIVFTERFSDDWTYDGQKPIDNLGVTNAFLSSDATKIEFVRFRYYLVGYFVSFTTLAILLILYFKENIKKLLYHFQNNKTDHEQQHSYYQQD